MLIDAGGFIFQSSGKKKMSECLTAHCGPQKRPHCGRSNLEMDIQRVRQKNQFFLKNCTLLVKKGKIRILLLTGHHVFQKISVIWT